MTCFSQINSFNLTPSMVKDGKENGKLTEWDENGQINSVATYKDGECISGGCPE